MSQKRHLNDQERLDWLRLARTPRVGPVTFFQLLHRFGNATEAIKHLPEVQWRTKIELTPVSKAEQELEGIERYGARLVCACEPDYPKLLGTLAPPPPVITALGETDLAQNPTVAIVGARDASAAGRKLARDLAAGLSKAGYVIVSGLARGIDGEAHAASLKKGTIAVLGGGIDHIYPPQHERLYAAIASQGLIVSESPFGYRAQARDFPRRNRIITGLALGVVVVEAAERSGSLISARTAGEQGREVMAMPGSPLDPRGAGTNRLIRNGATLVRHADDVLEALTTLSGGSLRAPQPPNFDDYSDVPETFPEDQIASVRQALSPHAMPIDEIARAANIGVPRCAAILVELELDGVAITLPGGLAARLT